MRRPGIEMVFSGHARADDIIQARIASDSAPRRLTVVSTDREIRKVAHSRRCQICLSEQFAQALLDGTRHTHQPPDATEPPEKRAGLTE